MQSAEYFIDSDPGQGNATPIAGSYGGDDSSIDINVTTDGLDFGVHWVFFRFQDNQGVWSAPRGYLFTVTNPEVESYTLTSAEYYIDSDPGEGNGTTITPVDGSFDSALEDIDIDVNTSQMEVGEHRAYIRFQDSNGNWSGARSYPFTVVTPPIQGDINGDFQLDILDVVLGVNIIIELVEYTDEQYALLDYNGDGNSNIVDLVQMVNAILDN